MSGDANGDAITVDPSKRFQTIDGFGFALTDTAAVLIGELPRRQRDALMRDVFDPHRGIGVSWIRVSVGPSDFTLAPSPWYSYQPSPDASFDIGRARARSPRGDLTYIIPLLHQAKTLSSGELTIFANPHSPPPWMKGNGRMDGVGRAADDDFPTCLIGYCHGAHANADYRDAYARYLVDFLRAYKAKGVEIAALGVQNEPDGTFADYPSGYFSLADQVDFIERLKRVMAAQRPPLTQDVLMELYPTKELVADAKRAIADTSAIDGLSYHCYFIFDIGAIDDFHRSYPDRKIRETECTQDANEIWAKTIDILISHTAHWANSVANWNLALHPDGGPQSRSCANKVDGECVPGDGLGTIMSAPVAIAGKGADATVSYNREYYEMGHFSKYVRPGAVRLATSTVKGLATVAFVNVDGSRVLIVHSQRPHASTIAVNTGDDAHFEVDAFPADGIATFVWPG